MIRRPAGRCRIDAIEPEVAKFQRIDEHIDRAYRIALVDPIIKAFRQQRRLLAIRPLNKTLHQPPAIQQGNHSIDGVFTQSGPTTDSGRLPEHALTRIAKGDGLFLKSRYGAGLSSLACITFNGAIVPVVLAFGSGAEEERAGFAPASTADAGIALFRALPLCSATAHIGEQPTGSPHADRGLGPPGRDHHDRGAHARSLSYLQAPERRGAR